jgi:hypothetical protein
MILKIPRLMIFRRPALVKLPKDNSSLGRALAVLANDADMLAVSVVDHCKYVVECCCNSPRKHLTPQEWHIHRNRRSTNQAP